MDKGVRGVMMKMEEKFKKFENGEMIKAFLQSKDINVTEEEGTLLLEELEKHGYKIGCWNNCFYCQGKSDSSLREISFDNFLTYVMSWNRTARLKTPKNQKEYKELKARDAMLNRIFEQTNYGKLVKTAAIDMMERYREVERIEKGNAETRKVCK